MRIATFALAALTAGVAAPLASGQTNVNPVDKFAWGENIGFLNFRDANGTLDGVAVLENHLRGWVWAENVGWINVGNGGGPYANTNNTNFGVNLDPATGNLSGFAWGENIGWINFNTAPTLGAQGANFDRLANGRFRGFAWGENVGWINLDDATIFPRACAFDFDGDGATGPADLLAMLASFGSPYGPSELLGLLASFGDCPG